MPTENHLPIINQQRTVEHSITARAPAPVLFRLIAEVEGWPQLFGPALYVQILDRGARAERFRMWALVGDEVRSWTSWRHLDRARMRIDFRQEHSQAPISTMAGWWCFEPRGNDITRIVLRHTYTITGDNVDQSAWIQDGIDRNSGVELAALKAWAERGQLTDELLLSFTDQMILPATAADAYAFLYRADLWPERVPHVHRVAVTEQAQASPSADNEPAVQLLDMETVDMAGRAHITRSIRLCFPHGLIAYKQIAVPDLLLAHSGAWSLAAAGGGVEVTARHLAVLDPDGVSRVLGQGTSLASARAQIRQMLGANSLATLRAAKSFLEPGYPAIGRDRIDTAK